MLRPDDLDPGGERDGRINVFTPLWAGFAGLVYSWRALAEAYRTSFARGATYWLASVVIMIRMTVAPVPIRRLVPVFRFSKGPILFVSLVEVLSIGTVFVAIPIVVILVATVVDPVVVLIVSMVFFLASILLRLGRSTNRCWGGQGCSKQKGTEKISITTVHVVFLLAQEFQLEILGSQRVCSDRPGSDVRFRTPSDSNLLRASTNLRHANLGEKTNRTIAKSGHPTPFNYKISTQPSVVVMPGGLG
jgi:hypothetical protein